MIIKPSVFVANIEDSHRSLPKEENIWVTASGKTQLREQNQITQRGRTFKFKLYCFHIDLIL